MSTDDNWDDDRYGDEDRFDDQLDSSRRPRKTKKGMSTGIKVVIVLVCVFGGLFVLCCGVGIYFMPNFDQSVTESPEEVTAITQDIVDIEIPEEHFLPQMGMDLDMVFMQMKMAAYTSKEGDGMLMIMEMKVAGSTPEEQEAQMREQMRSQNFGEKDLIVNEDEIETRTFTIQGKEIEFRFAKAKDPETGTAYRQVSGVFPGKGGTAFLMLQIEEEGYDEDVIVKIIESIK